VTVSNLDIPAFKAPTPLLGRNRKSLRPFLIASMKQFSSVGVTFTTARPTPAAKYSTIYVGGDDSAFSQYGSFLGLAEDVDVGNQIPDDNALVFF